MKKIIAGCAIAVGALAGCGGGHSHHTHYVPAPVVTHKHVVTHYHTTAPRKPSIGSKIKSRLSKKH